MMMALLSGCSIETTNSAARGADREPDDKHAEPLLADLRVSYVQVAEAFISEATPQHNVDSPASWRDQDGKLQVIATAKRSGVLLVYDGHDGRLLRTVAGKGAGPGQLDRPNGIAVAGQFVWVVERDNHRVQMFGLPGFQSLLTFGDSNLQQPYGLWVRPMSQGYEVIVSDNYMAAGNDDEVPPLSALGRRFHRYQLSHSDGQWRVQAKGTFGDTSAAGAIRIAESLWGDVENQRLLIAEEDVATGTRLREYGLDGHYRGRDVGAGIYRAQAEGIALMRCADGSGYWIGTDQFKDRTLFHVFDRLSLQHLGSFAGNVTANTDGIWLEEQGDERFPAGVLYAVHDDQALAAFDWRDISKALSLPECRR